MKKKTGRTSRGRPGVTVRLSPKTIRELDRVTGALGYVDRSAFLREFIEVTVAGNLDGMNAMIVKVAKRAQERLQMGLPGLEDGRRGSPRVSPRPR